MSDYSQGPGWWQASDGKWYPPEQAPGAQPPAPGVPGAAPGYGAPPAYGAPAGYGAPMPGAGVEYASWGTRVSSYFIDWVALSILANFVTMISDVLGLLLSLAGLAFGIYNSYLNGATGQSIGKRVVGTKVVSEATGQPIGGGMGIVRWLAHIVDSLACFIGWFLPLFDDKRQTISDKIVKTVVITGVPKVPLGEAFKS